MRKSQFAIAAALLALLGLVGQGFGQKSFETGAPMSDRDKAGLRGPVKTVVDEQTFSRPDGQPIVTADTTKYAPDGKILEVRHRNPDSSEWVTTYTYDPAGRLLKISSGNSETNPSETSFSYDQAGRMLEERVGADMPIRYEYDSQGRKSVIETYSSQPLPPNAGYVPNWDGGDMGFAPCPRCNLTTTYNEHNIATGAELRDSQGKLLGHIVRTFDANGRVSAEQQIADAPDQMVPEELRTNLNPDQVKAVGAFMAGGMMNRSISYSYDAQGRVIEKRRTGGVFGEDVIITTYNDLGDRASETTTTVTNPDADREYGITEAGTLIPTGAARPAQPPTVSEAQYTYQVDSYGNWTEQTVMYRSSAKDSFTPGATHRRKLTYY